MEAYKNWVRQNRQFIASLESVANTLTWLLPERFSSSEIGAESVAAVLGLMAVVNQHIIETDPRLHLILRTSKAGDQQAFLRLPFCLSIIKELEVWIEVVAEHYKGQEKKWNVLSAVEAIKACLRFLILHKTGYKMLIHGGEDAGRPETPGGRGFPTGMERGSAARHSSHFTSNYMGPSGTSNSSLSQGFERKATMALMRFGEHAGVLEAPSWVSRCSSTSESPTGPPCLPKPVPAKVWDLSDGLSVAGEWMFTLRPLIYVLLIRRYGLKSWKPWITSFALDASSIGATLVAESLRKRKGSFPSVEEEQETRRRRMLLALYLLRDPFFSELTRHPLLRTEKLIRPIPVLGTIAGKLVELISGLQTRYTYTSGS